jgi:hypothetical protein
VSIKDNIDIEDAARKLHYLLHQDIYEYAMQLNKELKLDFVGYEYLRDEYKREY